MKQRNETTEGYYDVILAMSNTVDFHISKTLTKYGVTQSLGTVLGNAGHITKGRNGYNWTGPKPTMALAKLMHDAVNFYNQSKASAREVTRLEKLLTNQSPTLFEVGYDTVGISKEPSPDEFVVSEQTCIDNLKRAANENYYYEITKVEITKVKQQL